jgi:hypothetical protein
MRASLLASAIANMLRCSRFEACSTQRCARTSFDARFLPSSCSVAPAVLTAVNFRHRATYIVRGKEPTAVPYSSYEFVLLQFVPAASCGLTVYAVCVPTLPSPATPFVVTGECRGDFL